MTKPSYPSPSHALKSVTRGRIKRGEQETEDSPEFSRRGTCGENWGESTDQEKREKGVCSKRANSRAPTSRRRRRRRSEPAHDRQMPRGTPAPIARPRSSGRGGSTSQKNTRCTPRPPPPSPAHLKGGKKKKKKTQEAKLPKKFPRKGKSKAQKEQSLKGEKMSYTKRTLPQFPLSQRPKAQDTTWH